MTFSDYLLDIVLIAIVVRQVREARFDRMAVLLPLGISAWVGFHYLHSIPTAGNDIVLIGALTAIGVLCGVVSGLATRVRADGGRHALVKAGWVAASTWVLSMGFRFAFAIWAAHGGAADLGRFSVEHHITSGDAWTAALVLMALGEVAVRTGILAIRSHRALAALAAQPAPAPAESLVAA